MARRLQRKKEREEAGTATTGGEDPDIADIRPGPQPPIEGEG